MPTKEEFIADAGHAPGVAVLASVDPALPGLMFWASVFSIEEAFEDLHRVTHDQPVENLMLPDRFADRYDVAFIQKYLTNMVEVSARITSEWTQPANTAQQLITGFFLDQIESTADVFAIELPEDWRDQAEPLLFDDLNFSLLYLDEPLPNGEDDVLDFRWWFFPLEEDRTGSPYSIDFVPDTTHDHPHAPAYAPETLEPLSDVDASTGEIGRAADRIAARGKSIGAGMALSLAAVPSERFTELGFTEPPTSLEYAGYVSIILANTGLADVELAVAEHYNAIVEQYEAGVEPFDAAHALLHHIIDEH